MYMVYMVLKKTNIQRFNYCLLQKVTASHFKILSFTLYTKSEYIYIYICIYIYKYIYNIYIIYIYIIYIYIYIYIYI